MGACDVRREQVGGRLNAADRAAEGACDGLGECGLTNAGYVFNENMTLTEDSNKDQGHSLVFADYDALDVLPNSRCGGKNVFNLLELEADHRRHAEIENAIPPVSSSIRPPESEKASLLHS